MSREIYILLGGSAAIGCLFAAAIIRMLAQERRTDAAWKRHNEHKRGLSDAIDGLAIDPDLKMVLHHLLSLTP